MESNEFNNTPEQETNTDLQEQLESCVVQRDEWKNRAIQASADFENYKKRVEKERVQWMSAAQSAVLLDLISVVDDFDRAFEQKEKTADMAQWLAGFELIYKGVHKLLEKYGIKEMKVEKTFDPSLHEAIMQVESAEHTSGDVVKVLQKGYMLKDQILRPAKVSVAK